MMDDPRPLAVRPGEAARLLGLSERTIRSLVASGEIPSRKVGAARLIPYADLERWLQQSEHGS